MSKMRVFPLVAAVSLGLSGLLAVGCHAEAKFGTEAKAPEPPPPPAAPPPPPPPAPEPKHEPIKAIGKAKITGDQIQIPGKITFELNKATIKDGKETAEILDTLYKVMDENKQITKLRIEGHTDNSGGDDHNMKLSQGRADAVAAWLATKGIAKERLVAVGMGEHQPIEKNDTEANKEKNRRTEFKIWELDGQPTDAAKAAPANGAAAKPGATPATPAAAKK